MSTIAEIPENAAEQKTSHWRAWLILHEIPLFFALAFAFSWTIYLFLAFADIKNETAVSRWSLIAAFGPSLAALFIVRITDPLREKLRIIQQALLFMLVFAAAFRIEWLDHKYWYHRIDNSVILADVILVSLISLVISSALSSWRGVRHLTGGLGRWKINPGWYLLALGLWPALVVVANALAPIFGMESPTKPYYPTIIPVTLLVIESLVWYFLFGAPLGEELGWRAYAQSRLQSRWNPLMASIIVGAFWGLWHVPLHLMGFYPLGPAGAIIRVFDIPKAIVFTWLFNRTRRSLWPVLLLHAAINTTSLFIARNYITSSALLLALSIVLVFTDKMWRPYEDSVSLDEPAHDPEWQRP